MKNKLYISVILIIAIVLVINLIFQGIFLRFDFTGDKHFTLSKATKDLLRNLPEPVTVKAYFSEIFRLKKLKQRMILKTC